MFAAITPNGLWWGKPICLFNASESPPKKPQLGKKIKLMLNLIRIF